MFEAGNLLRGETTHRLTRVSILTGMTLITLTFNACTAVDNGIEDGMAVPIEGLDASGAQVPETASWEAREGGDSTGPVTGAEGDFGSPCTENSECESGYCVDGPEGPVCTKTCAEACPEGYQCKGVQDLGSDLVFICVPILTRLCEPCLDDSQCVDGSCQAIDEGSYCVSSCNDTTDCPAGYLCAVQDSEGTCVPETGSCTCFSGFNGGQRTCWTASGAGECFGIETCDPSVGWTGCSALEPSDESCDYLDEDCDGLVDEDFKDDEGIYNTYLNCGACNVSCAFGFPNAAATTCDTSGPQPQCQVVACLPGYEQLNAYQCIPEGGSLCQPCEADDACLGENAACITNDDGSFCGQACAADSDCPDGYGCNGEANGTSQCVPLTGSCTCNTLNQGLSRACIETWTPSAPDEVAYACPGTETCQDGGWSVCDLPDEACDGVDDDCDGAVDEAFKNDEGLYDGVEHCGGCNVSCLALLDEEAHAVATCNTSQGFPTCD